MKVREKGSERERERKEKERKKDIKEEKLDWYGNLILKGEDFGLVLLKLKTSLFSLILDLYNG